VNGEVPHGSQNNVSQIRVADFLIAVVCVLFIPSAVVQSLLALDEKSAFAVFVPAVFFVALAGKQLTAYRTMPFLLMLLVLIGVLASLFSGSFSQLMMGGTLAAAVFVGRQLFVTLTKPDLLRAISWFVLLLLVGGVVAVVYTFLGGQPLMDVQVGYRTTHLYLTTFSFATIGNIIRPSGIFDEPGALAMYVGIVTMFNDTLRQNQKLNLLIIVLLLFTGSLAGVALAAWYVISSNLMRSKRKVGLVLISISAAVVVVLSFVAPTNLVTTTLDTFYSDRFRIENGRLAGDNRSNQVADFFRLVDGEMLLKGATNSTEVYDTTDMSSNPFSIAYGYGLLISLPYFALLLWLAVSTLRQRFRNSYTSLGLLFLLLQRPYLYHMSWSIMIAATVWLLYHAARERRVVLQ
jgi:hypothetical protein